MTVRLLFVDDDAGMRELVEDGLAGSDRVVRVASSAGDALAVLAREEMDVVVTDLDMPGMSGLDLCARIVADHPDVPVVVLTAFGSMDTAIGAIRAGAWDFETKPVALEALALTVERAAQHRALRAEVRRLRRAAEDASGYGELLGSSPAMRHVYDLLERVAPSDATVLVTGESGTGKELVARALHARSRRADGPFVAVNCAALPEPLLESELFGHVRGAFTDARAARQGLVQRAAGGTLFLDEIGDLPLALQPKLLRILQERVVRPVGDDTEVPCDVRVVAATNRDLESAIDERTFRDDLYWRLAVIHVSLPPLRSRGNDVLRLAQHFADRAAARDARLVRGISAAAAERLLAYSWPGNVRELQNCMERAVALARYDQIAVDDLPERIQSYRPSHVVVVADDPAELVPLEEMERRYVLRVLEAVGGNKTLAAQTLGLDRRTLYRKLERWQGEGGGV